MTVKMAEKYIGSYLHTYLTISLLFSLFVSLRLVFAFNMGVLSIVLYDIYYYVMPSIAIFILLSSSTKSKLSRQPEWKKLIANVAWGFLIVAIPFALVSVDSCLNTPLSYIAFPLIPVPVMCLYFKSKENEQKQMSKRMAALTLAAIILVPYTMAFLSFNNFLSVARVAESETDRAEFISDYVRAITISFWGLRGIEREYVSLHRASSDFLKFLLVGVGSCGEMAHATKEFFDNLDLESRVVSFPGEDHMFVEVKLRDTWLVVDPGYGLNLVTREERGSKRLRSLGGLSYVVAYTDQGLIEVTNHYVTTDQIIIRVTDSGEPIANAEVILKHTFMGSTRSLPKFYSDANGDVEFSLGPLTYNNTKIGPVEAYYWIWVNGRNTNLKVGSTGSGKSVLIKVDLGEKF